MEGPNWLVCVHEAGHAVVAHAMCGWVTDIYACPYGGIAGSCAVQVSSWKELVVFAMAGFWAQHHIADCKYPWSYASLDKVLWQAHLKENKATEETELALWKLSEHLVKRHRRLILRVAKQIKGRANQVQIRMMIDRTIN